MFHVRSHDAEVFAQRDRERFFKRRWRLSRQIKMLVTSVHTRDKHVELGHRINRIGDNTRRGEPVGYSPASIGDLVSARGKPIGGGVHPAEARTPDVSLPSGP